MRHFTKAITIRLTDSEHGRILALAEAKQQCPSECARELMLKSMRAAGGMSETEVVLGEVCGMSALLAELLAAFMASVNGGDGVGKSRELFDRAMSGRYEEARELLKQTRGV